MKKILVFFCCFFCLGFTHYESAIVSRIIDGDTLEVIHQNTIKKLRLYGIDAPEKNQLFGEEATNFLNKFTPVGSKVFIYFIKKDFFGRHVVIIKTQDNKILQEILLSNGLAWLYKKYCSKKWEKKWIPLEKKAQKNNIGLFQKTEKIPPWIWRKIKK